jgi:hypothetical protein
MKQVTKNAASIYGIFIFLFISAISACDRTSSPEGRISIQLENLHKEMLDSLKQQNRAMLDSLGKIREELRAIKQQQQ